MALSIDATTTQFITLPEVMREANVGGSADASTIAELDLCRESAQEVVEGIVGPVLWRTVTETVSSSSGYAFLTTRPVVSVTSATMSGISGFTFTADVVAGNLAFTRGYYTGGQVTVAYVAGRTSCPASVRKAALIIAAHLWGTQLGNAPAAMGGVFGNDEAQPTQELAGYLIPNRAAELLTPYALSSVLVA